MKRLSTHFIHRLIQAVGLVVLILAIGLLIMPPSVFAQFTTGDAKDSRFWPFYNSSTATNSCSASTASAVLTGSDNEEQAFNYFMQQGLSAVQAAGVVGNLLLESHVDPERIQDGGDSQNPSDSGNGGWGIAQWTPGSKIIGIAQSLNITTPIYQLSTQLNIVWGEMNGTSPTGNQAMVNGLEQINDVNQAAEYFEQDFEEGLIAASGGGDLADRQTFAEQVLQLYGASAQVASSTSASAASAEASTSGCNSGSSGIGTVAADCNFGTGQGLFTNNNTTVYPNLDQMCQRATQLANRNSALFSQLCDSEPGGGPLCAEACESVAEFAWLGHRGQYPSAIADWQAQIASGHAHPGDRNPPVGALLFYNTSADGHVAIYLGNNMVLSSDVLGAGYIYIAPATDIEAGGWNAPYYGWADPYFEGVVQ